MNKKVVNFHAPTDDKEYHEPTKLIKQDQVLIEDGKITNIIIKATTYGGVEVDSGHFLVVMQLQIKTLYHQTKEK